MANMSKVGNKNIIVELVGNKRVLEEFIFVPKTEATINTDLIPYTLKLDNASYESLGFVEMEKTITVTSPNPSTRTLNFRFYIKLRHPNPPKNNWNVSLTSGSGSYSGVKYIYLSDDYFYELSTTINLTATYDVATWNSFATTTTTLIKKLIYKLEPYSWKTTHSTIYTLTASTYSEMLSKYPASKLYDYKVCRVGESSYIYYICSPD
jgi:hypothetical protein